MNDRRNFLKGLMALAGSAALSACTYGAGLLRKHNDGGTSKVIMRYNYHDTDSIENMVKAMKFTIFEDLKSAREFMFKRTPEEIGGVESVEFINASPNAEERILLEKWNVIYRNDNGNEYLKYSLDGHDGPPVKQTRTLFVLGG